MRGVEIGKRPSLLGRVGYGSSRVRDAWRHGSGWRPRVPVDTGRAGPGRAEPGRAGPNRAGPGRAGPGCTAPAGVPRRGGAERFRPLRPGGAEGGGVALEAGRRLHSVGEYTLF